MGVPVPAANSGHRMHDRRQIRVGIEGVQPFAKHPDIFPNMAVGLTRAGEESGKLAECLNEVARLGLRDLEIRSRVRSAFIYPAIVLFLAVSIVLFFMIYVLPERARWLDR